MKTPSQKSLISQLTLPFINRLTTAFLEKPDTYIENILELVKREDAEAIYLLASGISNDYYGAILDEVFGSTTTHFSINELRLKACFELYTMVAEKGHVLAQVALAKLLNDPDTVYHDKAKAENYFQMAAESGSLEGRYALAMFLKPDDLFPEPASSETDNRWLELCRLAAEQGHVDAQAALGLHYSLYNPGPRDPREAAKWYQMAAEAGQFWSIKESAELFFELAEESHEDDDYARARRWSKLTMDEYCSRDNQYPDEYPGMVAIGKNLQKMLAKGLGGEKDQEAAHVYGRMYSELALRSIEARENDEARRLEEGYDLRQDKYSIDDENGPHF